VEQIDMVEDFVKFWKEHGDILEKEGIKRHFAEMMFYGGYNCGYEKARQTALEAITRNSKNASQNEG
jgi:hypothetical protein